MILLYPLIAVLDLFITLVSVLLLNWIIALFATKNAQGQFVLPSLLNLWQTQDNPLPGPDYWGNAMWLLRNPCYGFDTLAFGVPWVASEWKALAYSNDGQGNIYFVGWNSKRWAFNLYAEGKYGSYKLGWKAWDFFYQEQNFNGSFGNNLYAPFCLTINPFKTT